VEGTYDQVGGSYSWHEGFVLRYECLSADGRARRGAQERYQIGYPDGLSEWIDALPEPGIAFCRSGSDARVEASVLAKALTEGDEGGMSGAHEPGAGGYGGGRQIPVA
jgi:hypothetical protein